MITLLFDHSRWNSQTNKTCNSTQKSQNVISMWVIFYRRDRLIQQFKPQNAPLCGAFCESFTVLYDISTQNDPLYVGHFVSHLPSFTTFVSKMTHSMWVILCVIYRVIRHWSDWNRDDNNLRLNFPRNQFSIVQSKVDQKMPTNLIYSE